MKKTQGYFMRKNSTLSIVSDTENLREICSRRHYGYPQGAPEHGYPNEIFHSPHLQKERIHSFFIQ